MHFAAFVIVISDSQLWLTSNCHTYMKIPQM